MITQEMVNKGSEEIRNLIYDLQLTVDDKVINRLAGIYRVASSSKDMVTMYKVNKVLKKYLSDIQASSVHLHFYGGKREVIILQDMRHGNVVSIMGYEI